MKHGNLKSKVIKFVDCLTIMAVVSLLILFQKVEMVSLVGGFHEYRNRNK